MNDADSLDALQGLYSRSLVVEMDRATLRYRLHPLIREAASPKDQVRERHAQRVLKHLNGWEKAPVAAAEFIGEAEQVVRAGIAATDFVRCSVAVHAGNLARVLGRLAEAHAFYIHIQETASASGNKDWLQLSYGNQALILRAWGRLDEAMDLHKMQEQICLDLGYRDGLQGS